MVKNQFGDTAINVNQFGDVATGTTGTPQTQDAFFANLKNPIDLWIYESLPMIHANKGDLELKSVISHVDASYDDWERFINKEDIAEVIQEYMANLTSKFN